MNDWEDAVAYACSLPGVEIASWWGTPSPKINGKGFMSPGREKGSFALMVSHSEKQILFETDPDTFWQTITIGTIRCFSSATAPTTASGSRSTSGAPGGTG